MYRVTAYFGHSILDVLVANSFDEANELEAFYLDWGAFVVITERL